MKTGVAPVVPLQDHDVERSSMTRSSRFEYNYEAVIYPLVKPPLARSNTTLIYVDYPDVEMAAWRVSVQPKHVN